MREEGENEVGSAVWIAIEHTKERIWKELNTHTEKKPIEKGKKDVGRAGKGVPSVNDFARSVVVNLYPDTLIERIASSVASWKVKRMRH